MNPAPTKDKGQFDGRGGTCAALYANVPQADQNRAPTISSSTPMAESRIPFSAALIRESAFGRNRPRQDVHRITSCFEIFPVRRMSRSQRGHLTRADPPVGS